MPRGSKNAPARADEAEEARCLVACLRSSRESGDKSSDCQGVVSRGVAVSLLRSSERVAVGTPPITPRPCFLLVALPA